MHITYLIQGMNSQASQKTQHQCVPLALRIYIRKVFHNGAKQLFCLFVFLINWANVGGKKWNKFFSYKLNSHAKNTFKMKHSFLFVEIHICSFLNWLQGRMRLSWQINFQLGYETRNAVKSYLQLIFFCSIVKFKFRTLIAKCRFLFEFCQVQRKAH